jgi:CBS domain-containing protein
MVTDVKTCADHSTLNAAARIMWDNDCGCVPVVDGDGRVVGMITDRDICMTAYLQDGSARLILSAAPHLAILPLIPPWKK